MQWKRIISLIVLFLVISNSFFLQKISADTTTSATVPPGQSDFQLNFQADTATDVPQGTVINYTLTYGAKQSAGVSTTTTITIDFNSDTDNNGTHVLDYVLGSASSGYGNTQPVIDLTRRTITWTISNFPAGTINQTVTFQLKTNSNITGSNTVNFTVKANMSNEYVSLPQQSASGSYLFNASLSPTATPTPGPTNTPVPAPTATPVPGNTPVPTPLPATNSLTLRSISITGVTDHSVTMNIITSSSSQIRLSYGTASQSLTNTLVSPQFAFITPFTFDHLHANTSYFFTVQASDRSGQTAISDLFTVTTAASSTPPAISQTSLVLLSQGTVLTTTSLQSSVQQVVSIVLPTEHPFTVGLSLPASLKAANLEAVMRPTTLAANSQNTQGEDLTITVPLLQQSSGQYIANFITPSVPGIYEIFIRMSDRYGNIVESPLADIRVSLPFTVLAADTNQPIPDARIFLYGYTNKKFQPIDTLTNAVRNPSFTDTSGVISIGLPQGQYKADVSAFGYRTRTVFFTLGIQFAQKFPTVYLTKESISAVTLTAYFRTNAQDDFALFLNATKQLIASYRFAQSSGLFVLILFIVVTFIAFFLRTNSPMIHLGRFIHFHFHSILRTDLYVHGIVIDALQKPIAQATVLITDQKTQQIITKTTTDTAGLFYFKSLPESTYTITALKEGFLMETAHLLQDKPLVLLLHVRGSQVKTGMRAVMQIISGLIGTFFETFLVLCFILEFFLLREFGEKMIIFFIISCMNLFLWILFIREYRMKRKLL